jgi:cation transport ATPase
MECVLLVGGRYAATLRFHDVPREESRSFIHHLAPHHQVNKIMLVSGDRDKEVRYLAGKVGITEMLSGKSPEEKVVKRRKERQRCSLETGLTMRPLCKLPRLGSLSDRKAISPPKPRMP